MMMLGGYPKTPLERKQLTFDYSYWLQDGELLDSVQATVVLDTNQAADPMPVRVDGVFLAQDRKTVSLFVNSGTVGERYRVQLRALTDKTQVKEDGVYVRVQKGLTNV